MSQRFGSFVLGLAVMVGLAVVVGLAAAPTAAQASPYFRMSVGVTPGRNSCTLTWIRDYWDGPVTTYKIWVVPQDIAPNASQNIRKIPVTPQAAGSSKSVTVPGLTKGAAYVFWLEALYPSYFRTGQVSVQVATTRVCIPT